MANFAQGPFSLLCVVHSLPSLNRTANPDQISSADPDRSLTFWNPYGSREWSGRKKYQSHIMAFSCAYFVFRETSTTTDTSSHRLRLNPRNGQFELEVPAALQPLIVYARETSIPGLIHPFLFLPIALNSNDP